MLIRNYEYNFKTYPFLKLWCVLQLYCLWLFHYVLLEIDVTVGDMVIHLAQWHSHVHCKSLCSLMGDFFEVSLGLFDLSIFLIHLILSFRWEIGSHFVVGFLRLVTTSNYLLLGPWIYLIGSIVNIGSLIVRILSSREQSRPWRFSYQGMYIILGLFWELLLFTLVDLALVKMNSSGSLCVVMHL